MANGRVEIEVDVTGTGEASRDLGGVKDAFSQLGIAATAVGGAIVTGAAALRQFAMEADRQGAIISNFTGSLTQSRTAMGGMVSDLQMMEAHSRLATAGINLSGRDLRNVLVTAFQQAERTGDDFNQTLDQLGQAVVRGGRGLRQFGIDARTPNEALEQLEETVGGVSIQADTLGDRFEQLDATAENMASSFMESVEATGGLESAFTDLFNAVTDGETSFDEAMDGMAEQARIMGLIVGRTIEGVGQVMANQARGWRALFDGDFEGAASQFRRSHEGIGNLFSGERIDQLVLEHRVNEETRRNVETATARARGATTVTRPGRGRGGRAANDNGQDWSPEAMARSQAAENAFYLDNMQERADAEKEAMAETEAKREEYEDEQKRRHRESMERAREEMELQADLLEEQKQKAREASEAVREDAMGVLQPVVKGLTDAIRDVITGTKSADEAFQGLLSSFLEMIAQEAALSAAKEFAEAIASFARYDIPGGALHLAAGAAWTAVAVAAGAASVAVAPSASAPAEPEGRQQQDRGQGDQTVVINYASPVITSGTYAELGTQMTGMINEGERRFGRRAA